MMQLKDVLCWIGIHDWSEYAVKDVHFPYWVRRYRACRRCDTKQAWLGGHGGSEIGCWTPVKSSTSIYGGFAMIFICDDCGYEMDYDEDVNELVECEECGGIMRAVPELSLD